MALIAVGRYLFLPDVAALATHNPGKTSFMSYRERQWKKSGISRRAFTQWTPLDRISPHLVDAVIASEDAKYWRHHGFDFAEMKNAVRENLAAKKLKFGASTITQQLVKNLYLKPSKNFIRKISEAILTWRIEKALSKQRILEIYLNVVEWGNGIFGIERAARHFYGKPAADLSAEEAARLAVVLPNPRRYDPTTDGGYIERQSNTILRRMYPGAEEKDGAGTAEKRAEGCSDSLAGDSAAADGVIDTAAAAHASPVGDSGMIDTMR